MSIKYQPGTVMPDEYNWQEQFAFEDVLEPYIEMDIGKVRGLAIALIEAQERIAGLEAENKRLRDKVKDLNDALAEFCVMGENCTYPKCECFR
jgi:cell division protein FtsB